MSQDLQAEVVEVAVAVCSPDDSPDGPVYPFHEPIGNPFTKVPECFTTPDLVSWYINNSAS